MESKKMKNTLQATIDQSVDIKKKLFSLETKIEKAIELIFKTLRKGNKLLLCGNGGSAADAQHLAAEFLIRLKPKINRRPFSAISLAQDTSTITACGNDIGFENLFERNLEALGNKNDLLIALSTSGNSNNIIKVLKYAKKKKIKSICLLGNKGGRCKGISNLDLIVESKDTARIQECHIFLGHYIFEKVEQKLIKK